MLARTVTLVGAASVLAGCGAQEPAAVAPAAEPATMAVIDTRIWTGDDARPWAEALAVRGNIIVAVGTSEEIRPLIGENTEIVAVPPEGMVVPGFIDTHVHLFDGGVALASVQLRDAATPEAFARRFADYVQTIEPGEWILGGAWDHTNWGGELPRRDWIDALTPDNPVWVQRLDGHMALANTKALELAGVGPEVADVEGGEIVRDAGGELTGVLKDNAMALVQRAVPPPTAAQRDRQLAAAMDYFASNGVTTVHDMADFDSLTAYRRARVRGGLATRIYSFVPLSQWERLAKDVRANGRGDDWLRTGGLKGFMDGSLGSHTAAFLEPFTDAPGDRGLLINSLEDMRTWIGAADAVRLHVAVHAIGDRAIRDLLDIYRDVIGENGNRDRRFRMEHAQHIHPDDIARFAELNVIASMQPYHAIDDGRWADEVIGAERAKTTYAFRALLDSGARVVFGSDWFVAPATPLEGIYAAVTRRTLDGAHPDGWVPEQKITVEEALRAYTVEAAHASFEEDRKGRLMPGMLADFVVLGRDLFAIPAGQIPEVRVQGTIVGGRARF